MLAEQARKAMHSVLTKSQNLELPIDLQLKLCDHTVAPILLYDLEIWGYEDHNVLEKIHTEFLGKITKSKKSTPHYVLYAELGRLTEWCFTPLSTVFQSYHGDSSHYSCLSWVHQYYAGALKCLAQGHSHS